MRADRSNQRGPMTSKPASKAHPATRHVISINDLSDKDIEAIFEVAQSYLKQLPDRAFPLPHRAQHQRRLEFHPGEPVLRALDPHAAVLRKRHDPAGRPDHHQRRSGHQLGRQGRKPRRHRARDRQLCRHHGDPPSARRRRAARRRIFADPGHQRRRRQPRAPDPDPVRPVHAQAEEQAPEESEGRDLRRPQGLAHHPLLRLCAGAVRRDHHADAGQGHGAARACRSAAARGIRLSHGAGAKGDGDDARSTRSM